MYNTDEIEKPELFVNMEKNIHFAWSNEKKMCTAAGAGRAVTAAKVKILLDEMNIYEEKKSLHPRRLHIVLVEIKRMIAVKRMQWKRIKMCKKNKKDKRKLPNICFLQQYVYFVYNRIHFVTAAGKRQHIES